MSGWESELNRGLKNYCLQIMGYQSSDEEYNTEASVRYLEENTALEDERDLYGDLEKLENEGFLETEKVSEPEIYETDYLIDDTKVRITEKGQEIIEERTWDELADSARSIRFKRTEIIEG